MLSRRKYLNIKDLTAKLQLALTGSMLLIPFSALALDRDLEIKYSYYLVIFFGLVVLSIMTNFYIVVDYLFHRTFKDKYTDPFYEADSWVNFYKGVLVSWKRNIVYTIIKMFLTSAVVGIIIMPLMVILIIAYFGAEAGKFSFTWVNSVMVIASIVITILMVLLGVRLIRRFKNVGFRKAFQGYLLKIVPMLIFALIVVFATGFFSESGPIKRGPSGIEQVADVKEGYKFAGLPVVRVMAYTEKEPVNLNPLPFSNENAYIEFSGQVEVTGEYHYYLPEKNYRGMQICFGNLEGGSFLKLPRLEREIDKYRFCFTNQDFAKSQFAPEGTSGRVKILVDHYAINSYLSELWYTAELIKIMVVNDSK